MQTFTGLKTYLICLKISNVSTRLFFFTSHDVLIVLKVIVSLKWVAQDFA